MTTYEKELTVLQNRRSRVRVPVPLPKYLNKMSGLEKPQRGAFFFLLSVTTFLERNAAIDSNR